MTDKEIRVELAKAAIMSGSSIETVKMMYSWVCGVTNTKEEIDLDSIKVGEIEQYLGMSAVRFRNRCMENDIHTVGQLVRIGSNGFRALRLVGGGLVGKLGEVLAEKYGVSSW